MGPSCETMIEVRDTDPEFFVYCDCGFRHSMEYLVSSRTCPRCGKYLLIGGLKEWNPKGAGISRYSSMIPILNLELGSLVGGTPVESVEIFGRRIWFKHEHLNPSGSFKDRGAVIALSVIRKCNKKEVAEDSSGNTAIAIAMFSKKLGLKTTLFIPKDAPSGKVRFLELLGANVIKCDSRAKASEGVLKYVAMNPSVAYVDHLRSPTFIEGAKTIAYEMYEQIGEVGTVIAPVGSGGLMLGLIYGWLELKQLGLINEVPKFVAVQGVEVAPLYTALYGKAPHDKGSSRLADGIRVPNPPRLNEIASLLKKLGGIVKLVNDNEILHSLKMLIDLGIIVEPTSATTLAAFKKLLDEGVELREPIVLVLTGSGMKMIDELHKLTRLV